jgi:hydroxyacylglutathione hydrolase
MKIETFVVGELDSNCYIITCEKTGNSVIIDPGEISKNLEDFIKTVKIKSIVLTHGHIDHIGGVNELADETGAEIYIHELDTPMLDNPFLNCSYLLGTNFKMTKQYNTLKENDIIEFGESKLKVIHTPGHTLGGICLIAENEFIITGDTLFRQSVGRWDLPGGDYETLMNTIKDKIMIIPDFTIAYPGHGESTDIGFEKKHNQFLIELQ